MTYGVTDEGFVRKTFDQIRQEVQTDLRASLERPDLDLADEDSLIANLYLPAMEQLADVWELAEIVFNSPDPKRSTRQAFEAVAALRGVARKTPQVGRIDSTIFNFSGPVGGTLDRGAVRFHPEDEPDNIWINSDAFAVPSAGAYVVAAESELPGETKQLSASAIVEIVDGPETLDSITVPEDAVPGRGLEPEVTWRARSEREINAEQTLVGSEVEEIANVIAARVIQTPGRIRVIVNDTETPADNDEIAQAILRAKLEGVITLGSESGQATDDRGELQTLYFDRASTVRLVASCTITSAKGYSQTAVRDALRAVVPLESGGLLVWSKAFASVSSVDGVDDLVSLQLGIFPFASQEINIQAGESEVLTLAPGDISFT